MKKIVLNMIRMMVSIWAFAAFSNIDIAQAATDLKINLETNKTNYIFNAEPVNITITVDNVSGNEVITQKDFSDKPFHLFLIFKEKYGNIITADTRGILETPPMPDIIPDSDGDGIYEQVEGIERLTFDWFKAVGPFNAYAYYSLEPGSYLVTAQVSTRIIEPLNVITYSGKEYAQIGSSDWAGVLDSDTAHICIRADRDSDGYYYPACLPGAKEDCNDYDPAVNPGVLEIGSLLNNGKDDDCNPATADGGVTQFSLVIPNGGEVLPTGGTYGICWKAPSIAVKFDLKYSTDNVINWNLIKGNIIGLNCIKWEIPAIAGNKKQCRVKVIGYDSNGLQAFEDISDMPFTIEVLKVTSPNGREILTSGNTWTIKWQTNLPISPVAKAILQYSTDGTTWRRIKALAGNPGSYNWVVPSVTGIKNKCKIKVVLRDASGKNVGMDKSDRFFTIKP